MTTGDMSHRMSAPLAESTLSADGTRIGWERIGRGPALVVVHGGARAGKHYRALAEAMAQRYSVILMDRRGRGLSGPGREEDGLEVELADVSAVLAATGAERVFGHSAGAVIALEAALALPIRELALFEPPVVGVPLGWVPDFKAAVAREDFALAMALLALGLQMGPRWLPHWPRIVALPVRLLMRTREGKEMAALLATMPRDIFTLRSAGLAIDRHARVASRTLLLQGSRSPTYLHESVDSLTRLIPGAERASLDGVGHNAPDQEAPERVASRLLNFFS